MVETLEKRGAIVVGKTNTPAFGAGSQTFNEVFGKQAQLKIRVGILILFDKI